MEGMPAPAPSPGAEAAPQPEPYIFWNGQPYSRESAAAERASLIADKSFTDAALQGSPEHQQRLSALWQITHFGSAPTPPPENFDQVRAEMDSRAGRERAQFAEGMRQSGAYTDEQIHQVVNGRPIPAEEKRWHEQQLKLLKSDRELVRRYLNGEHTAVQKMRLHISGAAMRVGTLDEIKAWEAAHPFRKSA